LLDVTRSKHTEHALRQSEEQLRSLAAHLESIKEEERKRIARELHDELGGLLTAINAHVSVCLRRSSAGGSPPDDLLVEARDLAKRALQAVRRVITDLRPSVLDQLGIWAALEWYTEQVERCSGLDGECVIEPQAMALELDPERSTMLFRIVQETLTNVVRHAGATRVVVHVRYEEAQLIVEIADDGNGKVSAETSSYEKSWGIIGMHERSRHFGGELKITGTPGAGTVVVLKLPVEKS
jgi:two-component system sensor histidine kinase UhpB